MRSKKEIDVTEKTEYEKDLSIDPLALDMEWLQQPNLFLKYSNELALARKAKDEAKQKLLQARARERKELSEKGKVTEAMVEEELSLTEEWDSYIKVCYEEDILDGAVKAMNQRKQALENMVELLKLQYFAGPKEPRDFSKDNTIARSRIGNALNKKGGSK